MSIVFSWNYSHINSRSLTYLGTSIYANMRFMNCLGIWLAFLIKSIQNWLLAMRPCATCFLTSFIQNAILRFEVTILSCPRNVVKETEMKLFMVTRANPHQPGNGARLVLSMFFPLLSVFIPGIYGYGIWKNIF